MIEGGKKIKQHHGPREEARADNEFEIALALRMHEQKRCSQQGPDQARP